MYKHGTRSDTAVAEQLTERLPRIEALVAQGHARTSLVDNLKVAVTGALNALREAQLTGNREALAAAVQHGAAVVLAVDEHLNVDAKAEPLFSRFLVERMSSTRGAFALSVRVFIVLTGVALAILLFVGVLRKIVAPAGITVSERGAIEFKAPHAKTSVFLVSANAYGNQTPWIRTGIRIEKNERFTIYASGSANSAIHHIVASANPDFRPPQCWVQPDGHCPSIDGYAPFVTRPQDENMTPLLLDPKRPRGALLAQVWKGDGPPTLRPLEKERLIMGANTSDRDGELWLAINETWLEPFDPSKGSSDTVAQAYIQHMIQSGVTPAKARERWERIAREKYWNLWYDDNVGYYLVTLDWDEGLL